MKNKCHIGKQTLREKEKNCLLQAISPFLTMFSTAMYTSLVHCGNGKICHAMDKCNHGKIMMFPNFCISV